MSSVLATRPKSAASNARPSAHGHLQSLVDRLDDVADGNGRLAREVRASVSTSSRSAAAGTTRLTNPSRRASAAPICWPVSINSSARTRADEARQALCAAVAGNEPEIDLRLTEFRCVRRDAKRARHRQLAAAAERETIDGGDCRFAEVLDEIEDALATKGLFASSRGRLLRQLVDVGAGNERLVASSGDHDDADRLVAPEIDERGLELVQRPGAEGVHDRVTVDHEARARAIMLDLNRLERARSVAHRKRTGKKAKAPNSKYNPAITPLLADPALQAANCARLSSGNSRTSGHSPYCQARHDKADEKDYDDPDSRPKKVREQVADVGTAARRK